MINKKEQLPKHIWHFKGPKKGPTVLVLGGTHGDELTGVAVVRKLLAVLKGLLGQNGTYNSKYISGNLYLGFGNPEAILRGTRGAGPLKDLNRSFIPEELSNASNQELDTIRARELSPLLKKVDFLFDLHSTSSPSKPFVCFSHLKPNHSKYFPFFPVDTILTDPGNILAQDLHQKVIGTTDYFVNTFGQGLAYCFESGWEKDEGKVDTTFDLVTNLLIQTEVVDNRFGKLVGAKKVQGYKKKQATYKLTSCVIAKSNRFKFAKGMNVGWQKVKKGQLVGTYPNGEKEVISRPGYYLFPRAEDRVKKGRSLYYLAQPI